MHFLLEANAEIQLKQVASKLKLKVYGISDRSVIKLS